MLTYNFENRTAIVTGGSRGIGAATVKALLQAKATVVAVYSSNAEAYGWNKFITDSMMDKIRLSKGIPISEWEGKFTIRKNSSYEIKNVYEGDLETFLNTIMNKDVYYYSTDEWHVVINKVPHTEDSVTDMVNYLLTCFADGERDIVFNAWQDWMFAHRKELEEKK